MSVIKKSGLGWRRGEATDEDFCIEISMQGLGKGWWIVSLILGIAASASAGTPGSFRGTIVDGPHASAGKNWIYVQSRNGMARRVEISHARVTYDEAVPSSTRLAKPEDALTAGAEVRVTAEQDDNGEWRASRVEILKQQITASK